VKLSTKAVGTSVQVVPKLGTCNIKSSKYKIPHDGTEVYTKSLSMFHGISSL
jgi:hypothetical protein